MEDINTGKVFFDPHCVMHPNAYSFNKRHFYTFSYSYDYTPYCDYNGKPIKKTDWPFLRLLMGTQQLSANWLKRWLKK